MSERLFHKAAAGFEAARRLPTLPLGHQEQRLHGHSFKARVLAELPAGWGGFDGAETDALADALRGAIEVLDYRDLNQQLELPSDEHLAAWVQRQLMGVRGVPGIAQVGVQSTSEQGVELGRVFPELDPESKPVSTDTTGVDATRTDATRTDATRTDATRTDATRTDATRTDATSADSAGSDAVAGDDVRKIHVWRRFRFEAAHRLVNVPPDHQCGRMHGHGFEVILHAQQRFGGPSDGLAEKTASSGSHYDQLGAIWSPLHAELDHRCLNDLPGLENPTSELLAFWIWQRLKAVLPELSLVSVYETATAGCHYDGREYRIWKELRFEGALRLTKAPAPDARRRLHGHSYLLRLHLTAPLDEVLGWTVDYGDVKALFKPIYAQLDHHELNGLPQLADPSAAGIARWIRRAVADVLPQADRLELTERPGCGVLLCWGASVPRREVTVLPL